MSAAQKLTVFGEAKDVLMKPGVQWIRIDRLTFDPDCQPRFDTNRDYASKLAAFVIGGTVFPACAGFQSPDGTIYMGEGFHRRDAMHGAGKTDMLVDLKNGTKQDAIIFAAGSNNKAIGGPLFMSDKDITRAVEMLLAIDEWWLRTDRSIARYVGCSDKKVAQIRARLSIQNGRLIHPKVEFPDGRSRARNNSASESRTIIPHAGGGYRASYKGKRVCGATPEIVRAKLNEAMEASPPQKLKGSSPRVYCPSCHKDVILTDTQVATLRKQLAELPERPEESDPV